MALPTLSGESVSNEALSTTLLSDKPLSIKSFCRFADSSASADCFSLRPVGSTSILAMPDIALSALWDSIEAPESWAIESTLCVP